MFPQDDPLYEPHAPRVMATESPEPWPVFAVPALPVMSQTLAHPPAPSHRRAPGMESRAGKGVGLLVVSSLLLGGTAGGVSGYWAGHQSSQTTRLNGTGAIVSIPTNVVHSTTIIEDISQRAMAVVRQVSPAVVTIVNTQQAGQPDLFGNVSQPVSTGSGVIIDQQGDILTNNHVVENFSALQVVFANGGKTTAQFVGADPTADLAIIRVSSSVPAVASLGNSDSAAPGETVLAIGSALGDFQNTVTEGIISAVGRTIQEPLADGSSNTLSNVMQTDAAINHGNSGGPLVDLTGHVIGINTAIVRSGSGTGSGQGVPPNLSSLLDPSSSTDAAVGLGFAISSNSARAVIVRILHSLPTAYLGVSYQSAAPGARINAVRGASPAARAGLRVQDMITAINGQPVDLSHQLTNLVERYQPGDIVRLTIQRSRRTLVVFAQLGAASWHPLH